LYRYYWRIQLMFNSDLYSLYTPDHVFPITTKERYISHQKLGLETASKSRVVICGLIRDAEDKIDAILKKKMESMGRLFKDYHILIVENNSTDKTREKLLKWSSQNPKVTILGCGVNAEECHISIASTKTDGHNIDRSRITKMTVLRNIYLDHIRHSDLKNYDFGIVWDIDTLGTVYLDGVIDTIAKFTLNPSTAGICAYGIYRWGLLTLYYDTYAHLDVGEKLHIKDKFWHDVKKGLFTKYSRGDDLVEVDSCFSGFTVYRLSSLIDENIYYDITPPDSSNIECEHVRLHTKLRNSGHRIYLNPSMINLILLNN
jgi:hypothetical protein